MKTLKIPIEKASLLDKVSFKLRNEKYFLSFETNPIDRISILFISLEWFKKFYGKNGRLTSKSINETRKETIEQYKKALKFGIVLRDLDKIDEETNTIKINPKTKEPYYVQKLGKFGIKQYQNEINKGLLVLCEFV